jgi:hypothetical protein
MFFNVIYLQQMTSKNRRLFVFISFTRKMLPLTTLKSFGIKEKKNEKFKINFLFCFSH